MSSHAAHQDRPSNDWALAVTATVHCLIGCGLGEVLGMVVGTAFGWHNAATVVLSIALAFLFGYLLAIRPLVASGMTVREAVPVVLAAETLSITTMEVVDNALMLVIPGAMGAGLGSGVFWGSLVLSLAIAFVLTVPVNRWLISRGRGHALTHAHHSH
jgi:hypothetical protein